MEVDSTLTLEKLSSADEDVLYKVEAENIIGGISHPFSVIVNRAPEIIKAPASVELVEGEAVHLTVVATGKPLPQLTWYKDNQKLEDSDVMDITTIQNETETTSNLSTESLQLDHDGKYKVKATNTVGTAKTEFPLSGKYKLNIC